MNVYQNILFVNSFNVLTDNRSLQTPLGGIHLIETKRRFLEGTLHPANVLMCPHTCVTNLPKPREHHPGLFRVILSM